MSLMTVLKVKNGMVVWTQWLQVCGWFTLMITKTATTRHHQKGSDTTYHETRKRSKFKVEFLPNVFCFYTPRTKNNPKLNHYKLGTICTSFEWWRVLSVSMLQRSIRSLDPSGACFLFPEHLKSVSQAPVPGGGGWEPESICVWSSVALHVRSPEIMRLRTYLGQLACLPFLLSRERETHSGG